MGLKYTMRYILIIAVIIIILLLIVSFILISNGYVPICKLKNTGNTEKEQWKTLSSRLKPRHIQNLYSLPWSNQYFWAYPFPRQIWWNSNRSTRNMSYDIRGDIPFFHSYVGPWNISPYYPIHRKPIL